MISGIYLGSTSCRNEYSRLFQMAYHTDMKSRANKNEPDIFGTAAIETRHLERFLYLEDIRKNTRYLYRRQQTSRRQEHFKGMMRIFPLYILRTRRKQRLSSEPEEGLF